MAELYCQNFTLVKKQNKSSRVKFYNEIKGILEIMQDDTLMESVG